MSQKATSSLPPPQTFRRQSLKEILEAARANRRVMSSPTKPRPSPRASDDDRGPEAHKK